MRTLVGYISILNARHACAQERELEFFSLNDGILLFANRTESTSLSVFLVSTYIGILCRIFFSMRS